MYWFIFGYLVGFFVTLIVYKRYFHYTISFFEIFGTWYYQLPLMIIEHRRYLKIEQDLVNRKAKIWNEYFQEAYKRAKIENWSDADWQRWNESTENAINLIIR